jgi:2-polyprenyl-6-methoxyphenol hydroxylase-like FAD-dependent oxidoreductase
LIDHAIAARRGRVIERVRAPHYGLSYEAMVKAARAQLPPSVELIVGRVVDVETSPSEQRVRLSSGETLTARLVILAIGPGNGLCRKLGIGRRVVSDNHSLAIGFDLVTEAGSPLERSVLVHYGERLQDRVDYITVFPLGAVLRANLFAYRDMHDPWTREFRHRPGEMLLDVMPGIRRFLGDFRTSGKVQIRTNHLNAAEAYLRDGLVLIGDAFQTSCPAAGTGVGRLLTDVDRLCNHHSPRWLAEGDARAQRIAQFYDDPVKRACDAEAWRIAEYRHAVSTETGLSWRLHRMAVHAYRSMRGRIPYDVRNGRGSRAPVAAALDSMPMSG